MFVEIGVLNGGSLFMWRDYFGTSARIIGVDMNPAAKKWEKDGFEIFIGNQAEPEFWQDFFSKVGTVDVILDDGGHTNEQQIVTCFHCIPHINDGGKVIVEDTHTSYFKSFGNPSRYSFMNYAFKIADAVNSRFPAAAEYGNGMEKFVASLGFYESIVSFNIDRSRCFVSAPTSNEGISSEAQDFRYQGSIADRLRQFIIGRIKIIKNIVWLKKALTFFYAISIRIRDRKLKKYFHRR